MYKIQPTAEQINYTKDLLKVKLIGDRKGGSEVFNSGDLEKQTIGILSQVILADQFHQSRPIIKENCGDYGIDYVIAGVSIDLKTVIRTVDAEDKFDNNVAVEQTGDYYQNDVYLFASFNKNKNELTVCGWIAKSELFKKKEDGQYKYVEFHKPGTSMENRSKHKIIVKSNGDFTIVNRNLNNIDSKYDFIKDMANLSRIKNQNFHIEKFNFIPA